MKLKGISPIEQHVEKVVLAVVGTVFLAVVAMQFLRQPNLVEVGGKDYAPGRAYDPIEAQAHKLIARMGQPNPHLPDPPTVELMSAWTQALARAEQSEVTIASLGTYKGPGAGAVGDEPAPTGEFRLAAIEVPAPAQTMAHAFRSTISPSVKIRQPEIAALLPSAQPYDKAAVTVEAVFDGVQFAEMLATDPDGDEPVFARVPTAWYRDNLAILGVQVQRVDGLDAAGEPINLIDLEPLPGGTNLVESIMAEVPSVEAMTALVQDAEAFKLDVLQPAYLSVIAGPSWRPPSEQQRLAEIEANRPVIDRLVKEHSRLLDNLVDKELTLEDARKQDAPGRPTQGRGPRVRNTTRAPARSRPAPADDTVSSRVRSLERQLEQINERINIKRIELEDLGVDTDGYTIDMDIDSEDDLLDDLLESGEIHMWAHDLRVEPGRSYQYRTRVVVNNPLFGRAAALLPDQREMATQPVLHGAWSAWSEPVQIEQPEYYFITSASEGDLVGGPRVSAELYRFYYGFWRKATTTLEPGDVFLADAKLPDPNLMPIFDEVVWAESIRTGRPTTRPPGTPGGPRRITAPDAPRETARRPGRPGEAEPTPELPANATAGPETLVIGVDAVLLDVSSVPGSGDAKPGSRKDFQAYLSGLAGRIIVRNPAKDRSRSIYLRIASSAKAGLRQGAPEPRPVRKTLDDLRRERDANLPEQTPEPIRDDHGGGGGGGGTGGG